MRFTVKGDPVGKPRMTQRDRWQHRPCVMRYREWADEARRAAPENLTSSPVAVDVLAWLPMPVSWSERRKKNQQMQPHRQKPDADNILKAVCDALFADDSVIYDKRIRKFWDDGKGPRVEIEVY